MMKWICVILFLFQFETAFAGGGLCPAVIGNSDSAESRLALVRQFLDLGRVGGHQGSIELRALINHYQAALNFKPVNTQDFQFTKQSKSIEDLIMKNQSDLLELAKLSAAEKEGSSFGNSILRRKNRIQELELRAVNDKVEIDRAIKAFFDGKSDYFKYEKQLKEYIGYLNKLKEVLTNYPTRSAEDSAVIKQEILLVDQMIAANQALVGAQTASISQSEAKIQSALKIYREDRKTLLSAEAVKKEALNPVSNPTFLKDYLTKKLRVFYSQDHAEHLDEAVNVLMESLPKSLRLSDYEWIFPRLDPNYFAKVTRYHTREERRVDHILAYFQVYIGVSSSMREKAFQILRKLEEAPTLLTISKFEMPSGAYSDSIAGMTFFQWLIDISKSNPELFRHLSMFVGLYEAEFINNSSYYENFYEFPADLAKPFLGLQFSISYASYKHFSYRRIYIHLLTQAHAILKEIIPSERWSEFVNAKKILSLYKVAGLYKKQGHPLTPARLHALINAVEQMGLDYGKITQSSYFMYEIQQPKWDSLWQAPDEEFVYRIQLISKVFFQSSRVVNFRNLAEYSPYHLSLKEEAARDLATAFNNMFQMDELARVLLPDIQDMKSRTQYQDHLFRQYYSHDVTTPSKMGDLFKSLQQWVLEDYLKHQIKNPKDSESLSTYIHFVETFVEKVNSPSDLKLKRDLLGCIAVFEKEASRSQFIIELEKLLRTRGANVSSARFLIDSLIRSFKSDSEKLKTLDSGQVVRYFMRFEKAIVTTDEYKKLILIINPP